jgi:signal transduction histidine kinase
MAQGQLTAAAGCAAVLTAGVLAELASPSSATLLTGADYAVGAGFALTGAWLLATDRGSGWLSLATAASWFAGTAAAAVPGLPAYPGDVAALAYRGFLVHLLARGLSQPRQARGVRLLILGGYLAVLLPVPAAGLVTAALMAVLAAASARGARRAPADRRPGHAAAVVCATVLAVVWSLAAAGVAAGTAVQLGNDLALLATAVVLAAGSIRGGWLHGAINALVVELGPLERSAAQVSALLSEALADPQLEVRYAVPGLGWFDERGVSVNAPPAYGSFDGGRVTRVGAPDGGEVALLHGATAAAGPALAQAAARAAALALDNARLGAEVRQQAAAVRESRRRLLTVADDERRTLEARLRAGPAGRLQRVDQALAGLSDQAAEEIRGQLTVALDDLARLAQGLFPGALAARPIENVLRDLADGMPIPVKLATSGPLDRLPDEQRALAYFFCAECLANIARHARATTAAVQLRLDEGHLTMSVLDNGPGGAMLPGSRGLRGLADRLEVAGGRLTVDSPRGGPTCILADIPLT